MQVMLGRILNANPFCCLRFTPLIMNRKTLLSNLAKEVICCVCNNACTDPKTLPCLHTVCLQCLTKETLKRDGDHDLIRCRKCQRATRIARVTWTAIVKGGRLHELPTNSRINSFPDELTIKGSNTAAVQCGNCDKKSSQCFYCFQCCAFWCEADCLSLHNGIRANKDHRVLALKDFQEKDHETVSKRPAFCQKKHHEKEELLEFFCKICKIAICKSCALTDHKGHIKILLEEAADERKLQVKSLIESQKETALQKRTNIIAKLDESCKQIQEQTATEKQNAQAFAEKMITLVEAKAQEIITKVGKQERESLQRLKIQTSEIDDQVKITEATVKKTETLLQQSVSAELVQLEKSLDAGSQEVRGNEGERVDSAFEGFRQFIFVENTTLKNQMNNQGIGKFRTILKTSAYRSSAAGPGITEVIVGREAEFVLITRNAEGKQRYDKRDCVTVEIKNCEGQDCTTKVETQDCKNGRYVITYFAKEAGKYDVSVKINGDHISGSPFPVEVRLLRRRKHALFGELYRPAFYKSAFH